MRFWLWLFIPIPLFAADSVIASLDYGPACSSTLEMVNTADREAVAEVRAHKGSGALVLMSGQSGTTARIPAHGRLLLKLQVENESGSGWARVRDRDGSLALSASVECVEENRLVTSPRAVVYPMRNPWFAGDVAGLADGIVTAINVSERPARLSACYSAGNLVTAGGPTLTPLCSETMDAIVPPFGTRRIPVERGANSWFSVRSRGEALVLEMLRPLAPRVNLFRVDSTIQFGREVPPAK